MTTIKIPLNPFKAVQKAQSTEKTRYYLGGVFVEQSSLVATNGRILLRYNLDDAPTGVQEDPIILHVDPNEKAMKPKQAENAFMFVDLERLLVEVFYVNPDTGERGARLGVCSCDVIDGTFPSYKRIIPDNSMKEPCKDFAFDAKYISIFSAASSLFDKKTVMKLEVGDINQAPANVYFSGIPALDGVIMPCKF